MICDLLPKSLLSNLIQSMYTYKNWTIYIYTQEKGVYPEIFLALAYLTQTKQEYFYTIIFNYFPLKCWNKPTKTKNSESYIEMGHPRPTQYSKNLQLQEEDKYP